MFQSFDTSANPAFGSARVALLRAELQARELAGFLIPRADEHQGEYVPPHAERLAWLTGFTGSAGLAIVLRHRAVVLVDGRYVLQVRDQCDPAVFEYASLIEPPPSAWLAAAVGAGDRIGYDPWLHTANEISRFAKAIEPAGAVLVPVEANLVDAVWADRPPAPLAAVELQPLELAGEPVDAKLARLAAALRAAKADAAVLTQPDSIAWAFNIRGADVPHTPLPLSFAILAADARPTLFIDGRKLSNAVRAELAAHADIAEPGRLLASVDALAGAGKAVLIDPDTAAIALAERVRASGGTVVEGKDPVMLPKARKNAAELAGTRAAHRRDGAAMANFLAWFDREAPKGELDEIAVATALERCRAATGELRDLSFDTISGAGPNGAIIHYRVSTASNRKVDRDNLFLIDSGGQYQDGTTDITRTLAVGTPTAAMARHYTLVLKGMIAISRLKFPKGTHGAHIDAFARAAMWAEGLDYDHGTGHGVGSFLSVHEGPQRISKLSTVPFEPGMILSNEPGYYRPGEYGIRIENLIVVTEAETPPGGERPMHGFETLTLAPLDRRLIVAALLTRAEVDWIDAYHARVQREIGPLVAAETADWLAAACAPLA